MRILQSDHEKHIQRAKEAAKAAQMAATAGPEAAASQLRTDAASLYQSHDLRLKEGETIRINVKRPSTGGGFVSGNSAAFSSSTAAQPTVPLSVLQTSQQPKPLQQMVHWHPLALICIGQKSHPLQLIDYPY